MTPAELESAAAQRRTALWSLVAAGVLVVLKLGTGLATGSLALVSAGVESSGDVIAALLTLLAIRLAVRPADRDHNYGHRRAENIAALGEAAIVFVAGCIIAFEAVRLLIEGGHDVDTGWYVFVVIAIALVIDVSRITISLRAARKYNSAAFRSNAFNFGGDLAGSLAVLIGLALVAAGMAAGDAVAALAVAVVIWVAVARLVFENVRALMDWAPETLRNEVEQAIAVLEPRVAVSRLRLRESGGRVFADVTIELPPAEALLASHEAADRVEAAVRGVTPDSDVVVHTEPMTSGTDLRQQALAIALADPDVQDAHDISIYRHGGSTTLGLHLKFDRTLPLDAAHRSADRVQAAIVALQPGIDAVFTHLEPLERPVSAPRADVADGLASSLSATLRRLLTDVPLEFECRQTKAGPVVFVSISASPNATLEQAHEQASLLESDLRLEHPELVDVVVHTEPVQR